MVHHVKKEHLNIYVIYGLSIWLIIFFSFTHYVIDHKIKTIQDITREEKKQVATGSIFSTSTFSGITIEGKAYVVYDLSRGEVIAAYNENTILPLASITKVMTAVSSTLHAPKNQKVNISPKSIEDGYDLGLKNHQAWSLEELLKYTLVFSSNDGAEAVADTLGGKQLFLKQMNEDAKSLGLNFHFTDPAGRDEHGDIGGTGTAQDVALLFGIARKRIPEILDATTKKRQTLIASSGKVSGIPNTNQTIESFPGAEASKTGYTDLAGGNLGVIVDVSLGHPVVIVVLGSTREGRFRDVTLLYETLKKSLSSSGQGK